MWVDGGSFPPIVKELAAPIGLTPFSLEFHSCSRGSDSKSSMMVLVLILLLKMLYR